MPAALIDHVIAAATTVVLVVIRASLLVALLARSLLLLQPVVHYVLEIVLVAFADNAVPVTDRRTNI